MRYAIVSDIHANLQAWNAVFTDIAVHKVDKILCLGDLVGYGPNPAEVLSALYQHVDGFCMGNHDAVICGKLDAQLFNDHARHMIEWTRGQLSDKAVNFLSNLPLTLTGTNFRCTHGDFMEPAAFHYITDAESAAPSWNAAKEQLLFFGHTHIPSMFVIGNSGATHMLEPQAFMIEPGKRYLLNPGSVGNPRTGDALANYCIYDDVKQSVYWHKVPFDLDAFRDAIQNAGWAEADAVFLALDPRRKITAIRESVDFSPARNKSEQAQGVTAVSELAKLDKKAKRWKRTAITAAATGVLIAAAAISFAVRRSSPNHGALIIPSNPLPYIMPASVNGNWLPSFPDSSEENALPNWRVHLDKPEFTTLQIQNKPDAAPALVINMSDHVPSRIRIESPPIRISKMGSGRYTLRSRLERTDHFSGVARFAIEQLGPAQSGIHPVLMRETKDPPPISPRIQFTTDKDKIVPGATFIRLVIEGEFRGKIIIDSPSLTQAE